VTVARSNRPLLYADIYRAVSTVLATWPGDSAHGLRSMLSGSRSTRFIMRAAAGGSTV
jgi:hypothetical protein